MDHTLQGKTTRALLWMNLSNEPFVVLYSLLPFILRKDLHASLLQIAILSALKPVLPVFSFYWSAHLTNKKHHLKSNLMGAWILGRLPFLFIPLVPNVWYLIFCCGVYEFFHKSGIPALIEILKINVPKKTRERAYTFYFVLSFVESIFLGFAIGGVLDLHEKCWQFLCVSTALLGLSSIFVQMKVPIRSEQEENLPPPKKFSIIQPWKEALLLLKKRPDFAHFQWGFMTGGFGLMLIAPSLAIFYVDTLQLLHSQIVTGRSILMGIGIVISSYFWQKALTTLSISQLTGHILIGFALFPLSLILSLFHMQWFYFAFFLYGIAQAGSHILWNLSGTLFATQEDSSPFSRVNILMLGLRGFIAPALGGCLCQWAGPIPTLLAGAFLCIGGAIYMKVSSRSRFLKTSSN